MRIAVKFKANTSEIDRKTVERELAIRLRPQDRRIAHAYLNFEYIGDRCMGGTAVIRLEECDIPPIVTALRINSIYGVAEAELHGGNTATFRMAAKNSDQCLQIVKTVANLLRIDYLDQITIKAGR